MSATYELSAVATPGLTIDGDTVSSPDQIEVINPATAQAFIAVPDAGADEAIARANASDLGLGASVWSADEPRAVDVAARMQAGTVWVNQHPMLSPDVPFGGVKQSGLGVESSLHGLLAYTDISGTASQAMAGRRPRAQQSAG
jgi:acyl-CoA reductase-like NAD-dependent aldehyde dehydrogenase